MSKFEIVSRVNGAAALPVRATAHSAGYDFAACEDIVVPSYRNLMNGTVYRNNASKGMQLLATAFDETNGYTVPRDMDTWRRGVEGYHNQQMMRYTAKWRDLNGDWDMEKLGEEIRIDDDSVSEIDCVAMCYVAVSV